MNWSGTKYLIADLVNAGLISKEEGIYMLDPLCDWCLEYPPETETMYITAQRGLVYNEYVCARCHESQL